MDGSCPPTTSIHGLFLALQSRAKLSKSELVFSNARVHSHKGAVLIRCSDD